MNTNELKSHAMHDTTPAPTVTDLLQARIRQLEDENAALKGQNKSETPIATQVIEDCGTLIESAHFTAQILPHYYTTQPSLTVHTHPHCMEIHRVEELISLLQKAREIMSGKGL